MSAKRPESTRLESAPEAPLVGRDRELTLALAAIAATGGGSGRAVLIEGEPGIGKSRLIDEVLVAAREHGFRTHRAAAAELSWGRPFGTLVEALRPAVAEAATAAVENGVRTEDGDELGAQHVGDQRFRVVDQLLDHLDRLTESSPIAIALDDLQWADPSTLSILPILHRRLRHQPLLLVGAFRPTYGPELDRAVELLVAEGATHLNLEPLHEDAVETLVESLVETSPGPLLRQHVAHAGGNPWLIVDLLTALRAEDELSLTEDEAEMRAARLPGSFRAGVLRRVRQLPTATVEALRMASVLGTRFAVRDLGAVLGQPASRLLGALEPAQASGLLAGVDDALAFRHALVREAIYEELPRSMREALHHEAADALAAAGRSANVVAHHLALGAGPGDADAVAWLHRAAREVASRAPVEAVAFLERAVELCATSDPQYDEVTADLVTALGWAGRADAARARAEEALRRPLSAPAALRVHRGLVRALLMQGDLRGGLAAAQVASELQDVSEVDRAELLADAAMGSLLTGDLDAAWQRASEAVRLAETVDDPAALTTALCTQAWVQNLRGFLAESVDLVGRAVEIERATRSDAVSQRHPQFFSGIVLLTADRWDEGEQQLRAGRSRGEEVGTFWDLPLYHWAFTLVHYLTGRWEDFEAEVDAGLAHSAETGIRIGIVWPNAFRALIAVHRDQLDIADAALAVVDHEIAMTGPQFGLDWALYGRALLHEARGDSMAALDVLRSAWQIDVAVGLLSELHIIGPDLVRLAVASGDRSTAEAVTADVELAAGRSGIETAAASSLRCRGLLERDPEPLRRALDLLRQTPRRLELAAASEETAEVFGSNERDHAVALLSEAEAIYDDIGASRGAARVAAALRERGVRRGVRGGRRRPTTGWASLTGTERQAATLARQGLTNREIGERLYISRRTVETHLSHVFAKLSVATRRDLMLLDEPASVG